jgi:Tfp pilus assembly protein PilF
MADPAKIAARRKARRKPDVPTQTPSAREQEDVQVAGFYQNDGNFRGAYDRAKDAVSLDKDDAAAHLAVAESARKLGKLDEAEQEYRQTLALDPVPKVRKVAERALKEMTGGG